MQRNQLIDSLRGFSMIVIIFTHASAYFPSDKFVSSLWNWSNFAVPIFVFCSFFLFLKKNVDAPLHPFLFIKKRFLRLLIPYYIFLPFFFFVLFVTSSDLLSWRYVWQSVFVIGGVDINWLILLFLCLTIILPFFNWSQKKSPLFFWLFFFCSLGSTIYLLFLIFNFSYKYIMWLPWSVMLYFTYLYIKLEQNRTKLFRLFLVSGLLFGLSFWLLTFLDHDTVLRNNKYPPNLLYLSFSVFVLLGLILLENYIFRNATVLKILNFFSRYSYSIYFIHYLLLILFTSYMAVLGFNWLTLFLTVLFMTVIVQLLLIWVEKKGLLYWIKY